MTLTDCMYLFIIGCLSIKLYQVNKKKKIYYSNYRYALMALGEFDSKLREYVEKRYGG